MLCDFLKAHQLFAMNKIKPSHILIFSVIVAWFFLFGCPLRFLTGISCAGCGMTRALFALLHGDFAAAWHFHPLIYIMPLLLILFFFRNRFSSKTRKNIIVFIFVLFTAVYIIRIINGNEIVTPHFEDNAFKSLLNKIFM